MHHFFCILSIFYKKKNNYKKQRGWGGRGNLGFPTKIQQEGVVGET